MQTYLYENSAGYPRLAFVLPYLPCLFDQSQRPRWPPFCWVPPISRPRSSFITPQPETGRPVRITYTPPTQFFPTAALPRLPEQASSSAPTRWVWRCRPTGVTSWSPTATTVP